MSDPIGMRAAEFVGNTARRTISIVEQLTPAGQRRRKRQRRRSMIGRIVMGTAAVAAVGAAAMKELGNGQNGRSPTVDVTDLAEKSREELYKLAKKASIEGRSNMSKDELAKALTRSQEGR